MGELKKFKNIPREKPFDFTEHVEKQKEDNEVDLGLFFEFAEEKRVTYNQVPVNTLMEDVQKKMKNVLFTNGYFTLGDEREVDNERFFKGSDELAKFIDSILDKFDDHPPIFHTRNIYRCFRNIKRVNRCEHGRGANEFNTVLEYEDDNCYIPSGNACFPKCIDYICKKNFSMENFEFIQSYRRKTNVLTRCRLPGICERYKKDTEIYDLKSKRKLPRKVKQRVVCV